MITLKEVYQLDERADFQYIAQQLVQYYKLRSKIKFGTFGKDEGDYDWIRDVIRLRTNYPSVKEFLITVLHEIKHALDAKRMGKRKYEKAYQLAGDIAVNNGKDFHDDNKFEEEAEKWGKKEYRKCKNKI